MRQTLIFNFLLSVLLINSLSLAGQSFDVIPLPATRANSVSPDGKAVSGNVGNQSFIWTEEDGLTLLVAPPEFTSFIIGDVANEGIAAAISYSDRESYKWASDSSMMKIAPIVEQWGGRSRALGISADGSVVVGYYEFGDRFVQRREQPFRWTEAGGIVGLGQPPGRSTSRAVDVSSDGNVIAVQTEIIGNIEGFRWTATSGMVSIGNCVPLGISADGNAIVGHFVNNNSREAFRWTPATGIIGLGHVPGHIASEALAVSGNGNVVVGRSRITNEFEAAIWTENGPARLLQDVLTNDYGLDLTGWRLWQANDISEDGSVVVGWGTDPQNRVRAFRAVIKANEERPLQVNSTADRPNFPGETNCDTGQLIEIDGVEVPECTLRAALEAAAARGGANPITFNIPGSGLHTVSLQHALPVVPPQTTLDATTQPGYNGTPLVAINGSGSITTAFTLNHDESAIKGFSIGGFTGAGILINGGVDNRIQQCFIGVAPDGVTPAPNGEGLLILSGHGNIIGDPEGKTANLISANLDAGVVFSGESSRENTLAATFIGTDITGTMPLSNQGHGILIDNASDNIIGGSEEAARNIISGNVGSGVLIRGDIAKANQVLGNFIGVNTAGSESLPNGEHGVLVQEGASQNQIGANTGTAGKAPGNIISGNKLSGIMITGTPEIPGNGNRVQGNIIGLNAAGTETIPNGETGVHVQGQAEETSVGGESASEGNVIAGHSRFNIWIEDQEEALPISPLIGNNLIGTTSTGNSLALPRTPTGIQIGRFDAVVEVLGVPLYKITDNIVAGSNNNIAILGDFSESGEITGNNIGLFKNGNIALQDSTQGNLVVLGGSHVQIGKPGQGNHIGGANVGILLAASESYVAGNHIGVNPAGNQARPNNYGIIIPGSVSDGAQTLISSTGRKNIIGGTPGENGELQQGENIIAGNVHAGVIIYSEWGTGEDNLKSNRIKSGNPSGNNSLLPANKFLAQNEPWMAADSNIIIGNKIGLTASGSAMGNGRNANEEQRSGGIEITRGNGNMVLANEIGANGLGIGIYQTEGSIYAPGTVYISGNYIGTRSVGQNLVARPNQSGGIISLTSSPVVIGIEESNSLMQAPNIIAHNLEYGIRAMRYEDTGAGEGNISVRGNMIAQNEKGPYLVAISEEVTGSDVPGVPNFPELLSASVDSAMVKISGNAESLGMVDFYSGTPDQYDFAVATSSFKTSLSLEENTNFRAEASVEQMPLSAGDYISATLSIGATEEIPMTSHFSPVIRVAKAENVIESLFDGEDTGDLLSGLGITVSKEEGGEELQEEKSAQINSYNTSGNPKNAGQTSGSELHATLHELAPGFNIFDGDAISAGGTHYVAPDTLLASHYWTLAGSNINTGGFYVCLDVSDIDLQELFGGFDGTNPEERTASELVVLQRSYPGAPWTPGDSWFGNNGQSVCTNVLTPTGDFALGFNAQGNATPKTGPQVTFEVTDQFGNKIDDAAIILDGHQQPSGQYRFREIASGNYSYTVSSAGFYDAQGSFTLDQQDISISVTLESINTGIEYFEKEQFLAFPNPNKGSFTLKWNNLQAKEIRISDLQGRTVLQQNIPEFTPEIQVNLPNPVPGIYIVRLYANEKIIYRQILIK